MASAHRKTVLAIVATDATFAITPLRGGSAWVGKCFYCGTRLVIGLDGSFQSHASVEHLLARNHGGTDDLENLALACTPCNVEKGRRHDAARAPDPERLAELRAKRRARWRDP